ncbi:serine hydrolase domain-containing protein [Tenacibaculum ovolyticum]|uniref:serine hydrolase domain-containing protein n=1 Tax=Tenacibaculum ovolyticum TaxID=104270 RepID=UPI001F405734|nr:serine hydrolase domain-containing protein [Tenacibaculum ovolyticum]
MKYKQIIFIACLLMFITSCKSSKEKDNLVSNILEQEIDFLLDRSTFNSISVGAIINEETYELHKGELTKGQGNKPTNETLYEIASLTKTFTGTLLAKAIVDNKVSLDDDIRKVLGGDYTNLEFKDEPITYKHLVTHRSGIPNMFPNRPDIFKNPDFDKLPFIINKLQEGYTKDKFIKELQLVNLDTIPGSKFEYSNAATNLLGFCLENIYDKKFEDLLKENLLDPLKMSHTKILLTKEDQFKLAQGYNERNMKMPFNSIKYMNAEGGIKSTLPDMMKYVKFHLEKEDPVVERAHQEVLGLWEDFDNGLFWQIAKTKGEPIKIFQNGGAFGSSSWLTIIPEKKMGVFIITNQAGPEAHKELNNTVENIIKKINLNYKNDKQRNDN